MMFFSTRDSEKKLFTAAQAIKQGLALDGGLFVPEEIPTLSLDEINGFTKKSYPEIAADVLSRFLSDYTYEEILEDAQKAYSAESFPDGAAPLNKVKDGTPDEILPAVKKDIDEFVGEAPQFDDITMLCLEYKARMEKREDDVQ